MEITRAAAEVMLLRFDPTAGAGLPAIGWSLPDCSSLNMIHGTIALLVIVAFTATKYAVLMMSGGGCDCNARCSQKQLMHTESSNLFLYMCGYVYICIHMHSIYIYTCLLIYLCICLYVHICI